MMLKFALSFLLILMYEECLGEVESQSGKIGVIDVAFYPAESNYQVVYAHDPEVVPLSIRPDVDDDEASLLHQLSTCTTMKWMENGTHYIVVAEIGLSLSVGRDQPPVNFQLANFLMYQSDDTPLPQPFRAIKNGDNPPIWELITDDLKKLYRSIRYRKEASDELEIGVVLRDPKVKINDGIQEYSQHCVKLDYNFAIVEDKTGERRLDWSGPRILSNDLFCNMMKQTFKPSSVIYGIEKVETSEEAEEAKTDENSSSSEKLSGKKKGFSFFSRKN